MNFNKFRIEDPRIGLCFICLFVLASGSTVTYIGSVLTTLEKRFELNSKEMGAIMGANDLGFLLTVTFIAYFGSKKNRQPFALFLSGVGLWLSCMTYTIPYLIYGSRYDAESLINLNKTKEKGPCLNNVTNMIPEQSINIRGQDINQSQKSVALLILMIAGIINGISSAPWCLGISFLDDMAGPSKSGIYIGFMYISRTIAPILGFLLGSHILKYHESLQILVSQFPPGQKDIKWIGAWWLGWIILGFSVLIIAPFIVLLKVKNQNLIAENEENAKSRNSKEIDDNTNPKSKCLDDNSTPKRKVKNKSKRIKLGEFIKILKIIQTTLQNKAFTSMICGMVFEITSFICLLVFFTKYLEYHFQATPSAANLMSAFCLAGSSMISVFISGLVSHFYKTTLRNMNKYHMVVNVAAAVLFPLLFLFTCPSAEIRGMDMHSKVSMCSDRCSCVMGKLEPVCYNSTTYFSPCIAGCKKRINETFYSDCGCQSNAYAKKGFCQGMCLSIYGFLVVIFIIRVIGSMASVQFTQILMRAVNQKYKAVNLSIIMVLYAIFGLSLPPLAGIVLDTTCAHRNINKYGASSHCLIYDNDKMRYLILGTALCLQIPACLFYILSWYVTEEDPEQPKNQIITDSTKDVPEKECCL